MSKKCLIRSAIMILLAATVLMAPTLTLANWIGGISFDHPTPSYLPHTEDVTVTIDCKVSAAEGARIYVLPFTQGNPTPDYLHSGSPVVPMGESTVTRTFRISLGSQTVDHVRIRMNSPDNATVLLELFVRVVYVYGPYGIFNIQLDKSEYSALAYGENLNVDVDYASPGPDNVRIFARPYFNGSQVPGSTALGGVLVPPSGTAHQHFNIPAQDGEMDNVHFRMTSPDQSQVFLEFDLPAVYFWRQIGIANLSYSHPQPSSLHNSDILTVNFDYNNPAGIPFHVWANAYHDGSRVTGGFNHGSQVITQTTGTASREFGSSGDVEVNQVHLLVRSQDQSVTYMDQLVPVDYHIGPHAIYNISMIPAPPALLDFNELLDISFDYTTSNPESIQIYGNPSFHGRLATKFGHTGAWDQPPGSGSSSWGFKLLPNNPFHEIDQVYLFMFQAVGGDTLFEYRAGASHLWGSSGQVTDVPGASPGASILLGQNFPNPFNPQTTIAFELPNEQAVGLRVYDVSGRLVKTLLNEEMGRVGRNVVVWNGRDADGRVAPAGLYFYRLEAEGYVETKRMTLLK